MTTQTHTGYNPVNISIESGPQIVAGSKSINREKCIQVKGETPH